MLKKVFLASLISVNLFACCCTSASCGIVHSTVSSAVEATKKYLKQQDSDIFAKFIHQINLTANNIQHIEANILKLKKELTATKKTEAYYSAKLAKDLIIIKNLQILLLKVDSLNAKELTNYIKIKLLKASYGGKY